MEGAIERMRCAFCQRGLESAWEHCIGLVVETGASFEPERVYDYDSRKTESLTNFIKRNIDMVFEAHSTDFQTRQALTRMVPDQFAILKVGPWLTFAMREALFALSCIEKDWVGQRCGAALSRLPQVMRKLMENDPNHWRQHYKGTDSFLGYITLYGFSDRIRYYWSQKRCSEAIARLFQIRHPAAVAQPIYARSV